MPEGNLKIADNFLPTDCLAGKNMKMHIKDFQHKTLLYINHYKCSHNTAHTLHADVWALLAKNSSYKIRDNDPHAPTHVKNEVNHQLLSSKNMHKDKSKNC